MTTKPPRDSKKKNELKAECPICTKPLVVSFDQISEQPERSQPHAISYTFSCRKCRLHVSGILPPEQVLGLVLPAAISTSKLRIAQQEEGVAA